MKTLNQILKRLEKIVRSHKQVNSYYFGDALKRLESGRVKYTSCFVDFLGSRIDRDSKLTTHSFEILLADLVDVSRAAKDNEVEVFSDLTSIAEDIVAILNHPGFDDWEISNVASLGYFREKFTDETAAVRMTVDISIPYLANRCQIPIAAILHENGEVILSENRDLILSE